MRRFLLLGIFAVFLVAGCAEPGVIPIAEEEEEPGVECRIVTEEVPFVEEVCEEVSFTEEVCGIRKLPYTASEVLKTDLCIKGIDCVGKPLSACPRCSQAMTRCILKITNNDEVKSGTWTVGANFSLPNAAFIKDPITQTIDPNETFAFDFTQIYAPGYPVNSAICKLAVIDEPFVDDCHDETRTTVVCQNVTKTKSVEKEVCE